MLIIQDATDLVMTDAQTYYNGLIAQGYPTDQALGYTQQYYPGFMPATTTPASISQPPQTIPQPQTITQPQPVVQSQPITQQIPSATTMGMLPTNMMPAGEKPPIMAWAAVGCLAVSLLLAAFVQFTNTWYVNNDEDSELSWGLNSVSIDCVEMNGETDCTFAYLMLRDGYDDGIPVSDDFTSGNYYDYDFPEKESISGSTKVYCDNTARFILETFQDEDGEPTTEGREQAEEIKQICLEMNSAGNTGGLVIWMGALGALLGTIMLVMSQIGKTLPSNAERFGKLTSWISGGLIILGLIIWSLMKSTDEALADYNSGMSFYLALIAGLLAITAGILEMLDKRE